MKRINQNQEKPSKALCSEDTLPIIGQKLCCYLALAFNVPPIILNSVFVCFPLHSRYYPEQEPLVPVYYRIHVWMADLGFHRTYFARDEPDYGESSTDRWSADWCIPNIKVNLSLAASSADDNADNDCDIERNSVFWIRVDDDFFGCEFWYESGCILAQEGEGSIPRWKESFDNTADFLQWFETVFGQKIKENFSFE